MAFLLFACGKEAITTNPISIDENGIASWLPIEGAVYYEYCIVDGNYTNLGTETTTETTVPVPEGRSIHMRPVC